MILALAVPSAFLADILVMLAFHLSGGDATSIVSGTAVLLMCLGSVLGYGRRSLEKVTFYLTEGFLFAIRIFAPVIVIGAFFFLGGSGITVILGEEYQSGILNDWALWLAGHAPLNQYMAAALQLLVGGLTGLDGSGFSGLPLTGALALTFGTATGALCPCFSCSGTDRCDLCGRRNHRPLGHHPGGGYLRGKSVEAGREKPSARLSGLPGRLCRLLLPAVASAAAVDPSRRHVRPV